MHRSNGNHSLSRIHMGTVRTLVQAWGFDLCLQHAVEQKSRTLSESDLGTTKPYAGYGASSTEVGRLYVLSAIEMEWHAGAWLWREMVTLFFAFFLFIILNIDTGIDMCTGIFFARGTSSRYCNNNILCNNFVIFNFTENTW